MCGKRLRRSAWLLPALLLLCYSCFSVAAKPTDPGISPTQKAQLEQIFDQLKTINEQQSQQISQQRNTIDSQQQTIERQQTTIEQSQAKTLESQTLTSAAQTSLVQGSQSYEAAIRALTAQVRRQQIDSAIWRTIGLASLGAFGGYMVSGWTGAGVGAAIGTAGAIGLTFLVN